MHADAPPTIRSLLQATTPWLEGRGSPSPRLDAELLIAEGLGLKRLDLYLDLDRPLSADEVTRCRALVKRRGAGEPVAYILGYREFWGARFAVSPDVLIPRPETERLVELALERLPDDVEGVVVDVGTGSGCVLLSLLLAREGLTGIGTDLSPKALAVAAKNAETLGLTDRVEFREGDLLGPCSDVRDALLVVSNPPYVLKGSAALAADVARFEPALALYGEDADGLGHHRRILKAADAIVGAQGAVLMEMGFDQGDAARGLATQAFPGATVATDLDGHDRVVILQR